MCVREGEGGRERKEGSRLREDTTVGLLSCRHKPSTYTNMEMEGGGRIGDSWCERIYHHSPQHAPQSLRTLLLHQRSHDVLILGTILRRYLPGVLKDKRRIRQWHDEGGDEGMCVCVREREFERERGREGERERERESGEVLLAIHPSRPLTYIYSVSLTEFNDACAIHTNTCTHAHAHTHTGKTKRQQI